MPSNGNRRYDFGVRLTKAEEKLIAHDKELSTVRKLLVQGAKLIVANDKKAERRMAALDEKIDMLIDAQLGIEEAHQRTQQAQQKTEASLQRLGVIVERYIGRNGGRR